jgi:hypothetical protein
MQSEGNGTVLLLVSKSDPKEYDQLEETVLCAFVHLGIPYKLCNIDEGCPPVKELLKYACLILGQNHLGKKLGQAGATSLRNAVKEGVGLVSFDGDIGSYDNSFSEIFNVQSGKPLTLCSIIKTVITDHYITGTRETEDDITLDKPVEVWPVEVSSRTDLLQTDSGLPIVIPSVFGKGRAVLFTSSVKLWTMDVLGHARGLDDVFWKSVVWAARKPFAIYAMPPFATALMDDCSGSYNHFRYVDVMNKYGWIPHIEVYLEDIDRVMHHEDYADSKKIKSLYDAGLAEFGIHGFTYSNLMWFDHYGRKSLSDQQINENFKKYDEYFEKWGIKPSRIENMHFGEIGSNALPFLKERGVEYLSMVLPFDTAWHDVPEKKAPFKVPGPYRHRGYYMADLPEDPHFFISRSFFEPKDFISTDVATLADYLWDNTIFWDESPRTNIERAAAVAALQVRRGIDARFYGITVAHEQRVAVVRMDEWEEIYAEIQTKLKKYDLIYCSWEKIFDYARSHYNTRINSVNVNRESGKVHCTFQGEAQVSTLLEVYTNNGNSVKCQSGDVPSFIGAVNIELDTKYCLKKIK